MLFGREYRLPIDNSLRESRTYGTTCEYVDQFLERMEKTNKLVKQKFARIDREREQKAETQRLPVPIREGDLVLLNNPTLQEGESHKFHRKKRSAFKVLAKLSDVVFRLQKLDLDGKVTGSPFIMHRNNMTLIPVTSDLDRQEIVVSDPPDSQVKRNPPARKSKVSPSHRRPHLFTDRFNQNRRGLVDMSDESSEEEDSEQPLIIVRPRNQEVRNQSEEDCNQAPAQFEEISEFNEPDSILNPGTVNQFPGYELEIDYEPANEPPDADSDFEDRPNLYYRLRNREGGVRDFIQNRREARTVGPRMKTTTRREYGFRPRRK